MAPTAAPAPWSAETCRLAHWLSLAVHSETSKAGCFDADRVLPRPRRRRAHSPPRTITPTPTTPRGRNHESKVRNAEEEPDAVLRPRARRTRGGGGQAPQRDDHSAGGVQLRQR